MNKNYIIQLNAILAAGSFSQEKLAQQFGVTFAALNRWMNGHAIPHPRRMVC